MAPSSQVLRDRAVVSRPASAAPSTNAARDTRQAAAEKPGAPAAENPRITTLPVIFAVKTWPSPR